ncbi:MAG: methyl-accepting chemotaxis protein [Anaerolineales bacterium]
MKISKLSQFRSLQTTVLIWTAIVLLIAGGILVLNATITTRNMAINNAKAQALSQGESLASQIKAEIEVAMDGVRTMANALKTVKDPQIRLQISRRDVSFMIRQLLLENRSLTGVSTLWDPNAFDGMDSQYVNAPGGYDQTGRLLPYWHWDTLGNPIVEPLTDYETSEWVVCPKTTKNECITEPYLYPINGVEVLMTTVVAPIVVDNTYYGLVTSDIDLQFLQNQYADQAKVFNGAGTMAIVTNKGMIGGVTGKKELVGKQFSDYEPRAEEIVSKIQAGQEDIFEDGGYLKVVVPITVGKATTPWGVYLRIPMKAVTATANQLTIQMVIIGVVLIILGLLGIWYAFRSIAIRPIKVLQDAAKKLAQGETDISGLEKVANRPDELGDVGKAFNELVQFYDEISNVSQEVSQGNLQVEVHARSEKDVLGNAIKNMINSLKQLISRLAASATQLSEASVQLANVATQAGQATNQIAATVQQVAKGTSQQSESVNRTAASVEQMSRAINGVARGAQEQAQAVAKASSITTQITTTIQKVAGNAQAMVKDSLESTTVAQSGAKTVEETVQGMEQIKTKVNISAQKVEDMGQRSNQIGAIVETIEDIASQTNLLALNAAIEAARAGEHGKGFAVVADEVRKLAERSSHATKEIAELVKSIRNSVAEAISAMGETLKEVEAGASKSSQAGQALSAIIRTAESVKQQAELTAEAARMMDAASNDLVSAMDSVSAVVEENTAATEEMAASSNEVTEAIENIASVSEENSAAIEEVSASAEEMSAQVQEVMASAQTLAQMAQSLQELVNQFKLEENRGDNHRAHDIEEKSLVFA